MVTNALGMVYPEKVGVVVVNALLAISDENLGASDCLVGSITDEDELVAPKTTPGTDNTIAPARPAPNKILDNLFIALLILLHKRLFCCFRNAQL